MAVSSCTKIRGAISKAFGNL